MIQRSQITKVLSLVTSSRGRLVVLAGARQVGKTTLVRSLKGWDYVDMDDPASREAWIRLGVEGWLRRYRRVIVDEIQKAPELFEVFKACHDRDPEFRALLLGSSQLLLLKGVRESLAGRASLLELHPFMLEEVCAHRRKTPLSGRFASLLGHESPAELLESWEDPVWPHGAEAAVALPAWESLLTEGMMPAPTAATDWTGEDRREWCEDYVRTYLQKDLAEIARLEQMDPFVRLLRLACLRTAQTANWSDLAREAGISGPTARTWMGHLETGYHALSLPPWFRNPEKRLARAPKLHVLDAGIRRAVLRRTGPVDGAEFETAVVSEAWKHLRTHRLPLDAFHLRTQDGREVDLLLERTDGYFAIECKSGIRTAATDARHLLGLEAFLDKPLLAGLVVSNDPEPRRLRPDAPVWAMPAAFLFG